MMDIGIRILNIECDISDSERIKDYLKDAKSLSFEIHTVQSIEDSIGLLINRQFDVILLSLSVSDASGFDSIARIQSQNPELPLIVLLNECNEGIFSEVIRRGAQDCIDITDITPNHLAKSISCSIERKKLLSGQIKSEIYYKQLLEMSPEAIIVADSDMRILFLNLKACQMLHIRNCELVKDKSFFDFILKVEHNRFQQNLEKLIHSEESGTFEYKINAEDNKTLHAEVSISLVKNQHDASHTLILILRDAGINKRAELALRESEEWYRALFEESRDAIYISTRDGRFLDINEAGLDLFGYKRSEIIGLSTEELYKNRGDRAKFINVIEEKGSVRDYEVRLQKKNGSEMICLLTAAVKKDRNGEILGYQGIIHDISEFKKNYNQLQYRIEFDKLITAISTHFINLACSEIDDAITDALRGICKFTGVERSYVALYNAEKKQIKKTHEWSVIEVEPLLQLEKSTPMSEFPWYFEKFLQGETVCFNNLNGLPRLASVERVKLEKVGIKSIIIVPMWYGGKIVGLLGFDTLSYEKRWTTEHIILLKLVGEIFINAIQNKKTQKALRFSEEQLRQAQKMEAIGQLAGGVAHDFNNLLTVIAGHTELAMMSLDPFDPLYQSVEQIQRASESASNLTRQLLAFSRKQNLEKKVVNINDVIGDMSKMLKRIIGENITLHYEGEQDLWQVETDPSQLGHVIINLAVNAKDAMPNGGHLSIVARNQELDDEFIRAHSGKLQSGEHVMISVSDTGEGIPKELQDRVFDPFFTTKEAGRGTGLGLSMAYGVIQQSGGDIWLYSEPGRGCTFNIFLPRVISQYSELIPASVTGEMIPGGTECVLVVEDEDGVRQMVQRVLEKTGYEVLTASSGMEALSLLRQHEGNVNLVITDIIMPNMSGPQLYEFLKNKYEDVSVLYISGYTVDNAIQQGLLKPGVKYMQKPFKLIDLAKRVREVLDGKN